MTEDSFQRDAEIIRAAYAEKVQEAFRLFAENISVGQSEKSCRDRFIRSLLLMRKARDIALEASNGGVLAGDQAAAAIAEVPLEPLSAEDQAMIDQAVGGTTGAKPLHPAQPIRRLPF